MNLFYIFVYIFTKNGHLTVLNKLYSALTETNKLAFIEKDVKSIGVIGAGQYWRG